MMNESFQLSESDMEYILCHYHNILIEDGLTLINTQIPIGSYRLDILFEDERGDKLIVEIQKGTLDRNHSYKIEDYIDEYKQQYPHELINAMIIANSITEERKTRLKSKGIEFKEIQQAEFWKIIKQYDELTNLPTTMGKRKRAMEIIELPPKPIVSPTLIIINSTDSLKELIEYVLDNYEKERKGNIIAGSPMQSLIVNDSLSILHSVIKYDPKYKIKGSVGISGNWTYIPWVAVMDQRITSSTQRGFFICYLFAPYQRQKKVTLAILIGIKEIVDNCQKGGNPIQFLQNKCINMRNKLVDIEFYKNFKTTTPNFTDGYPGANRQTAMNYEAAHILHKEYFVESMPTNSELIKDLEEIFVLYQKLSQRY